MFLETSDKLETLIKLCDQKGIDLSEVAHVGDDVNDIPVLNAVGCPISVADAVDEAKRAAVFVTEKDGGQGAVREVCEMILAAKSKEQ